MEVWLSFVYTDLPEETIKRSQEVLNLNGHIRSSSLTNSVIKLQISREDVDHFHDMKYSFT